MTNTDKLSIGKKLDPNDRKLPKTSKEEIRETLCYDEDFIEFCKNKLDWTPEEHNNLKNILELPTNDAGYYVDIFKNRVSYNGDRTLRKEKVKFQISKIHQNEILKCKSDFDYFRRYYALITTRNGISRPEHRPYQIKLWDALESLDDVVCMFPRQASKTISTSIYFLWRVISREDPFNAGITANKPSTATEILDKIKKIFAVMPIWLQAGVVMWNKGSIEFENGTRILTSAPNDSAYRGYTINLLLIDEAAYIPKTSYESFMDSVAPTLNSLIFKQMIVVSTPNGVNHFKHIVDAAKRQDTPEKYITCSWRDVPHYSKDGKLIEPEVYKKLTIQKFGTKYFNQTEALKFLGSSDTLVSSDALKDIEQNIKNIEKIPNNILIDLNLYQKVEKNHTYIVSVDPSKDGIDLFSVNVTDVTKFPFIQVADSNLDVDYLVMPEHLNELGLYFNNALIIIENNEGAGQSITDTLYNVYEYENLYRDKNTEGKVGNKKYTGFRTTSKSRELILNLLKIFIDEGKLIINSKVTLNQLYTFTKRKTGKKYEAEDGFFDDNIMSLAIMFAPFMENRTFDNYELFVKELKNIDSEQKTAEFLSVLDIGFSSDDDDEDYMKEELRREMLREMQEFGLTEFSQF